MSTFLHNGRSTCVRVGRYPGGAPRLDLVDAESGRWIAEASLNLPEVRLFPRETIVVPSLALEVHQALHLAGLVDGDLGAKWTGGELVMFLRLKS